MRLDQHVRAVSPGVSWTQIRDAISSGQVSVDGTIVRDVALAVPPQSLVHWDHTRVRRPYARLDLPRLYEDDDVLVVDKPAGLLTIATHPEARDSEDTVLRRAQAYATHLRGPRAYAGVLHRLDRGTSGALALALSRPAHRAGRELFARHRFERWYIALVHGSPRPHEGTIDLPVAADYRSGRRRIARDPDDDALRAVTHYRVHETYREASLLEIQLDTGRQHQIRLHLQHLGHPLIGERVYAQRPVALRAPRQMLHAWRVRFQHPVRDEVVEAEAPLPEDMEAMRALLRQRVDRLARRG